jgi:hypothetical protein
VRELPEVVSIFLLQFAIAYVPAIKFRDGLIVNSETIRARPDDRQIYHSMTTNDILHIYQGGLMRILVDVPTPDLQLLDEVIKRRTISRAEFIRQAIATSLTPYRRKMNHAAFGAWSDTAEDGLAYQDRIRGEW